VALAYLALDGKVHPEKPARDMNTAKCRTPDENYNFFSSKRKKQRFMKKEPGLIYY
jgi:hypothetical protein